jgi:hypothetical protein
VWLVGRAAVRQPWILIPPGNPTSVQPKKIQEQETTVQILPSAAAGENSAAAGVSDRNEDEFCINTVDRKLQNKQKECREGHQKFKLLFCDIL